MRIRPTVVIALLMATNLALGYMALRRGGQQDIKADHLQQVRLNTQGNGTIYVTLGTSDTPAGAMAVNQKTAAVLALTPRAAIQLQVELTRVIKSVQGAARQGEGRQSPDRPL